MTVASTAVTTSRGVASDWLARERTLLIGLIANLMVRPIKEEHPMTEEGLARERSLQLEAPHVVANADQAARGSFDIVGVAAWALVGIPFLIGVWIALSKAAALF
ncbi:MFS transporter small subunit [Dyella choica]|uniref:Uncharacterized protein n=1 Tax=Dyella choica TaxID=1927959 RepID=A0A3S0WXE8_9GAMM|nr:hypothetical protein [Dyella choica]RUL78153.1 hypothetical protein EKH80_04710 [Dyella choica]